MHRDPRPDSVAPRLSTPPTDDALLPAQRAFARMLGRQLAELWEREYRLSDGTNAEQAPASD
jgi:hypothetical protein